jgi:hypothetical protein
LVCEEGIELAVTEIEEILVKGLEKVKHHR